jgi:excisionase family DNA binding protein
LRYSRRGRTGAEQPRVTQSTPKSEEPKTVPFAQRFTCTINEACEVTGLGRTKLYELIGTGHLATTRVGRRRLVLVSSAPSTARCELFGNWLYDENLVGSSLHLKNSAMFVRLFPLQSAARTGVTPWEFESRTQLTI